MNVLFVASECAPFIKTGGLADVIGSVPKALSKLGVDVRVLLPAYPELSDYVQSGTGCKQFEDLHGGTASVVEVYAEGLPLLLLDAPHLFNRAGNPYLNEHGDDWHDNHLRYGGLARVAAEVAIQGISGWKPDIVHAHDWQAGLVSAYLKDAGKPVPRSIITIHNIAFQGIFPESAIQELGLPESMFHVDGFEYFEQLSFLKAGLVYSDKITTVSPSYAHELMLPEFGMGLEGIIKHRRRDVLGILNGIDMEVWDPQTDKTIPSNYSSDDLLNKELNKKVLESRFGLQHNASAPLFCVVSRLTAQKGLDVLLESLHGLVAEGARLVLLGTGEKGLEEAFRQASRKYAGSVGVVIGYDEDLSRLMFAGSDAIIIPSRFEPCGLTQLYGLRYGAVPVVARTGGLADTIIDANVAALNKACATGFQFTPVTQVKLSETLVKVCETYAQKDTWESIVSSAMQQPLGWEKSAEAYLTLYKQLLK